MNRFERASRQTRDRLVDYEDIVRRAPINTLRNLDQIAATIGFGTGEKLGSFLAGRNTLDLGAGFCGLALEAYLGDFSRRVYSLSPGAANPGFEKRRWELLAKRGYLEKYTTTQLETALKHINGLTFPYCAHDLPFSGCFFDLVIDNWAVSLYANPETAEFYEAALAEVFRILRQGGVLLIGDPEFRRDWIQEIIKRICRQRGAKLEPVMYHAAVQTGWKITA